MESIERAEAEQRRACPVKKNITHAFTFASDLPLKAVTQEETVVT